MIVFREEAVADCWDEVYGLAYAHWRSTENYRRHEPFEPSRERYVACNEMGFFHLLTARDGGVLVGYLGLYLTKSMHSQKVMVMEDTFYLDPLYRGGRNALRFLLFMEKKMMEWRAEEGLFSCEIDNTSGIRKLLEYLNYKPVIVQFSKAFPLADSCPDREDTTNQECA